MFCICNIISFIRIGYWKTLKRMKVGFHEFRLKTTIYYLFIYIYLFLKNIYIFSNDAFHELICVEHPSYVQ
jgi:hypothetical protein